MNRTRSLFAAGLLGALLVACSSGPAATPSPTPTPTPEPTPKVTPSDDSGAVPSIDLPNSDAELEALLPDEIGGLTLQKSSMKGDEFLAIGDDTGEFADFLSRMNAQPDDVSIAFAFGPVAESSVGVSAFRVQGANRDELIDELRGLLEADGTAADLEPANVGGKDVLAGVGGEGQGGTAVYLYGTGDIVFFISTTDEDSAAEVLSNLP